jgi:hypothetical protein
VKKSIVLGFALFILLAGGAAASASFEAVIKEIAPQIKVAFGGMTYQKDWVWKKEKAQISPWTSIRIEYEGAPPFGVQIDPIVVDDGAPTEKSFMVKDNNISSITYIPETSIPQTIRVDYTFPEELSPGKHTLSFYARSLGRFGSAAEAVEKVVVQVVGGPIRLTGFPLAYPSPFSIRRDKEVIIQYRLSENAPVDIYLTSVAGERIKKFYFSSGEKGGKAGLNKVNWNGVADRGGLAGNGIYFGTIVDRNRERLLGKFKLTVVN